MQKSLFRSKSFSEHWRNANTAAKHPRLRAAAELFQLAFSNSVKWSHQPGQYGSQEQNVSMISLSIKVLVIIDHWINSNQRTSYNEQSVQHRFIFV